MNILLANIPIRFNSRENLEPPLGIAYLGAVLEQAKHKVCLKDFEVEDFAPRDLENFILREEIDLLGISFRTASYRSARQFAGAVQKMKKVPTLVAGGHHASAFSEYTLKDLNCNIVVRGEAEQTVLSLVQALEEKRPLNQIRGICFRQGARTISTEAAEAISNLDELPYPARHLLAMEKYNAITMLTSRGCPFNCIYCDKSISTRQVKFRSPENVYNEIAAINKAYPGKRLFFVDDHFFLAKSRLNKIFDLIENNGLRFNWIAEARVDGVDLEMLKRARRVGCELIMYGIESGDPQELRYMRKQTTVEQGRRALLLTRQAGIKARANFMIGFPISTHQSIRNTIRFARSVPLDVVRFFFVAPLPNTELWDRVYGQGTDLTLLNWDEFDFYTPTFSSAELTREQIKSYPAAALIHVLKKKVLGELTFSLLPRLVRLLRAAVKSGRIRGNISLNFPATVNLLVDLKTEMHSKGPVQRLKFLIEALALERDFLRQERKTPQLQSLAKEMAQFYQTSDVYFNELAEVANRGQYESYLKYVDRYAQRNGSLLDLGCGLGVATRYFSQQGFRAHGIDVSLKFISYSQPAQGEHLKFICGSVFKLPFQNQSFDVVGSFDVIEHLPDVERFLEEGLRVLNDKGIYVMISPCVLTPFTPLKAVLTRDGAHSVYTSRAQAFRQIFINLYLIFKKKLTRNTVFYYRRPHLNGPRPGKDEDAVYLSSPIDLRRFLEKKGLRILHYQNDGPNFIHRIVGKVLPDFASTIYIVAQKDGRK